MGIGKILSGEELTTKRAGIVIVGWLVFVSVVSVLLLLYTAGL
ncbi:hypothetical protein J2751_001932 [Halorubrum alkaliphilum]|uniref:Uncharacterized protein n=1 Tax=Halorubrum alkaliphilum TaxID=261290 RepID=A0A8T4GFF9_9EURY|nr:hypothetical protein [Halorubrum alkaliphilum]MBP1922916.1 hypothetical protein [Halorubrum alkaliphilum]